jgi:FAD/FMN-containing dehydrogenase
MSSIEVSTIERSSTAQLASTVNVSADFPIVWQHDEDFERARVGRVFNHRRPSRYPLAVIEARMEEDIVEAVRIAKQLNCKISVRSGGHSWAVWSVRDNAILIDLGKLNSIEYDDDTGIVRVGPATPGGKLNTFLEPKGLMFNGGHCPTVGLGGFLYVRLLRD